MKNELKIKLLSAAILLTHQHMLFAQDVIDTARAAPRDPQIEEIVTVARYIPDEKRSTAAVANVLDAEAFKAAGDSNVADGLKRVAGLNLQGGKFIYIRGLGERYSSTVLNGSTLPSPEPVNRVVPLDIFPSSIISSVLVQKTYSAEFPAEFAGGTIEMRTKSVPEESFFQIESGMGYSGNTTGNNGYTYEGGAKDWQGRDKGKRDLPDLLKAAITGNRELTPASFANANGFTKGELEAIGESLEPNYQLQQTTIDPDVNVATSFGKRFDLNDDINAGVLGSLNYSNSWDTLSVTRKNYAFSAQDVSLQDDYLYNSTEHSVDTSMFLTGGINYKDSNSLKMTVLQIRKMDDLGAKLTGLQATEGRLIDQNRLEWIERDLLSEQLEGEHVFYGLNDMTVNWHYNQSRAKQEAPDMREYRYELNPQTDEYIFSLRGDGNTRTWSDLRDENTDKGFSAAMFVETPFGTNTEFKFGMNQIDRDRTSQIRRFVFVRKGALAGDYDLIRQPNLNDVINASTIDPQGYQLQETTRSTDNYLADQSLDAWFGQADIEVNHWLRLMAGVRSESSEQHVQTFALFSSQTVDSVLKSDDLFPVVTATIVLDDYDMQLRAGYSKTISRPDFRELSPAPFTHPVTGYVWIGNPDLENAYIKNYDARWEWYFSSDESLSIGLFYKEFDKPIEAIVNPGSSQYRTFVNANQANSYGIEFDTYHWLDFVSKKFENFYVSGNLTLLKSEVDIAAKDRGVLTSAVHRLQGQADYIANVQLGFDDGYTQKGSLVYHLTGEKIRELGIFGGPDIMDEAYGELDATYTRYFGDKLELNLKLKNLTNEQQLASQDGLEVNGFRDGRSVSVNLTYNFR